MDVFDLLKETGKVDCSTMQGLQDIFEKHGIVESKSLELELSSIYFRSFCRLSLRTTGLNHQNH